MSPVRFEQPRDDALARGGAEFFTTPLGRDLERAEMELLRQMLDDCFGARALLLGAGTDERVLDALHVQRRFVARIAAVEVDRRLPVSPTQATVVDPCNLPFENDAFDVVVLFHGLDMAARPHQALREAARVLADGGRLIVTGFNPWSLWGLRRLFARSRAPWNAHFLNPVRMTDWLSLLDFSVTRTEFARYRPPVRGGGRFFDAQVLRIVKGLVRMPFGGVWLIKARHRAFAGRGEPVRAEKATTGRLAAAARPTARAVARRRGDNVLPFEPRT
jgi:SAM-dependent methyltransferase